jgi:hypothetical protein
MSLERRLGAAEEQALDRADRGVNVEGHLDGLVVVGLEIDATRAAVALPRSRRGTHFGSNAAAVGTDDVPRQVQEPQACGLEKRAEHASSATPAAVSAAP